MILLSQRNPAWAKVKLGKSNLTVHNYGCTTVGLSMLSDWYGMYTNPGKLAQKAIYTSGGLIIWKELEKFLPMKFVYRYYKRDDAKIKEILASKDGSCLLQVNDGKHWVVLVGYSRIKGYKIFDPWFGDAVYLSGRYPNITGFSELTRK
jgi:hypothetical protein